MTWDDVPVGETTWDLSTEEPAVTDLLRALCEPGYPGELAGQSSAVAAFSAANEKALVAEKSARRRSSTPVRGAKLAAAALVGSLVLGGVAAAAMTGVLPGPLHAAGQPSVASDDPTGGSSTDPSSDPSGSADPSASPDASASTSEGATSGTGTGPSVFAVCWYVVHKTNSAAGGPGAVQAPSAQPGAVPTDGTDASDALDHGNGAWSQEYARIKATAQAQGESVLTYCTAQVVAAGKGNGNGTGNGTGNGNGNGNGKKAGATTGSSPKPHGNGNGNGNAKKTGATTSSPKPHGNGNGNH